MVFRKVRAKAKIAPPKVRAKAKIITYRRQVVIKTSSRTTGPVEIKIKGFQNPKPRTEGGSAAATRPLTPLSLSARLCGPVLAVKGSLRRFAPLTAPGRSWATRCL